jgi:hypothetical protein
MKRQQVYDRWAWLFDEVPQFHESNWATQRDMALNSSLLGEMFQFEPRHGPTGVYEILEYFSQCISEWGLKPWGHIGRTYLIAAIEHYNFEYDYEHWLVCQECGRVGFSPKVNPELVALWLDLQRGKAKWEALYCCQNCGGKMPLAAPEVDLNEADGHD